MDPIYKKIRNQAKMIAAAYPSVSFYNDYSKQVQLSLEVFNNDKLISQLVDFVTDNIENDFGHGLDHAKKVALDAGALIAIEGQRFNYVDHVIENCVRMAQCAGLLHDIKRKHKKHAFEGALVAKEVLGEYSLSSEEIRNICLAIENHEAFGENTIPTSEKGALLSNCLYDSDKFRWGPENFTHTVWAMVEYANIPIKKFVNFYPRGISFLEKIKDTFRTDTGKAYGPQIIDLGLSIGHDLYAYIKNEFNEYLKE